MISDKDRLDELKQYSIPTSEYWWFSGPEIAISKKFFKYWTVFTAGFFVISTAVFCLTNWWQLAFIRFGTFLFVDYYYIGFPIVGITLAIWYIRRSVKEKKKLLSQIESARIRKYQDSVIEQNAKR
jgi:mannose/fructose/N-acetylgalactosamine-specific phosphotransferase system component IIC